MARTILPFGPQHPVLPEPLHLKLTLEDEIVVEALPTLGYVHRGLEKLCEIRDLNQMIQIVERVCGICSCLHALCYCQAIEKLAGLAVPPRAEYLRLIWGELHRLHSHLLWIGLFADAFGFESLFMQAWKIRERVMDIMEATCGNRVVVSVNVIGGVRRDLSAEHQAWIDRELTVIEGEIKRLASTLIEDVTVCRRTKGKGVLTHEQAHLLGAVGPTLRGSGWAQDTRMTGYSAFDRIDFEPVVEKDGDSHARLKVRFNETLQSIDLARQALRALPALGDDGIATPFKGKPSGEVTTRVEQPRGELFYYVKANGSKYLDRVRIRTPTFANIPPLLAMLPGLELADVPVVVLSIDPCISCTER